MTEMMQAIIAQGDAPLSLMDVEKPQPGPEQVRIKVVAAGLNRADILQRKGMYPPPPGAADIMGLEVSGTIDALGNGVEGLAIGAEVCALLPAGGYAQYAVAHAGAVMPIPKGVTLVEAAGLPETVMTVWANVFDLAHLAPGETLFVQGGASGIGTTAVQMAKEYGARVFVTAGSDEKCAACMALGADGAFNYRTTDFEAEMKAVGGADVILDMVGGNYLPRHVNMLKQDGRLVHIAVQGGLKAEINILKVMSKRLIVTGSTLRGRTDTEKAVIASDVIEHVWPWVEAGAVKPVIDSTFALADAECAHKRLTSGAHVGKIILTA